MLIDTKKLISSISYNGVPLEFAQSGGSGGSVIILNQDKTITKNGTDTADSGYTGLGTVIVAVEQTGGGSTGGGSNGKFTELADGSITEVKEEDLKGATKIRDAMFSYLYELEKVTIPSSVKSIGWAFDECGSLKVLRVKGSTPPTIDFGIFDFVHEDFIIMVDKGCGSTYKNATNWCDYANIIVEETDNEGGNEGEDTEENWFFKGEHIDYSRADLPEPVVGVSYTLFVDGEEIGTDTARSDNDRRIEFYTEDFRVWMFYEYGAWHFHPVDSQVQSGTVSIRINGLDSDENWLFHGVSFVDGTPEIDIPDPVDGVSYTFFYNSTELGTDTASYDGAEDTVYIHLGNDETSLGYDGGWSCYKDGKYSVRINDD